MIVKKITHGYVEQTFSGDVCISQRFVAGDYNVEYEHETGEHIDSKQCEDLYFPFIMASENQFILKPEDTKKLLWLLSIVKNSLKTKTDFELIELMEESIK